MLLPIWLHRPATRTRRGRFQLPQFLGRTCHSGHRWRRTWGQEHRTSLPPGWFNPGQQWQWFMRVTHTGSSTRLCLGAGNNCATRYSGLFAVATGKTRQYPLSTATPYLAAGAQTGQKKTCARELHSVCFRLSTTQHVANVNGRVLQRACEALGMHGSRISVFPTAGQFQRRRRNPISPLHRGLLLRFGRAVAPIACCLDTNCQN